MKQITIRGLPEALISLLEKVVWGRRKAMAKRGVYHDLDHLSGAWAREEAEAFDRSLRDQRAMDKGLWKK